MLQAGLDNFATEALGNFNCFGNAAAFCDQARHVCASCQISAVFEKFDAQPDSHLIHFRDAFMPFRTAIAVDHKQRRSSHFIILTKHCVPLRAELLSLQPSKRLRTDPLLEQLFLP